MSEVVLIVQARIGSTRLPGKVLQDIEGRPMLARVVERARQVPGVSRVLVATTTECAGRVRSRAVTNCRRKG
jgi:spore coat polysaccharide biosynthesis protein SpsF